MLGENIPNDKRSDPHMHGRCAEAEALSKGAEKVNITNMEELRKLAKNSVSTANRNDKKGKPKPRIKKSWNSRR